MSEKKKTWKIGPRRSHRVVVVVEVDPKHDIISLDVEKVLRSIIQNQDLKKLLAEFIASDAKDFGTVETHVKSESPDWVPHHIQISHYHKRYHALVKWYAERVAKLTEEAAVAEVEERIRKNDERLAQQAEEINRREAYLVNRLRPTR